jgi:hypothetical protein
MEIKGRRKIFTYAKGSSQDRNVESKGMSSVTKDMIIKDPEVNDKEKHFFIIHGTLPEKYKHLTN